MAGRLVVLVAVVVVWVGAQGIIGWVNGWVITHQESPYRRVVSLRTVLQEVVEHMGSAKLKEIVQVSDKTLLFYFYVLSLFGPN